MNPARNQVKVGVLFSYVNIGTQIIVSLLYTPYLIRILGQKEFGLFSIAFAFIGIFSIMDLGLGNANVRYTARCLASGDKEAEHSLHGTFLVLYLFIGFLALLLGLSVSLNAGSIFGGNMSIAEISKLRTMLTIVVVSLSLAFPLSVFGFIIRGYEHFVFTKVMEFLKIVLIPLVAILILILGYRSIGVITIIAVTNVMLLIANVAYCYKVLKIELNLRSIDPAFVKEILAYSFFVFLGVLAFHFNNNTNQLILGITSGSVQVAIYALGFNLVINFYSLASAITGVFLPTISKIPPGENQIKVYNNYFTALGRLQFFVIALFYLGFLFFGKLFIALWAGKGYENSYYVCIIPLTTFSIFLIQTVGIAILQAQNKHRFSSLLFALMALFNILSSIYLSSHYGAIGAAVSIALTWLIGHGITMNIYYAREIKLNVLHFWMQILKILPSFIVPVIFAIVYKHFFRSISWWNLGLGAASFALIYIVSVIIFSFNDFERDTILNPIRYWITHQHNR